MRKLVSILILYFQVVLTSTVFAGPPIEDKLIYQSVSGKTDEIEIVVGLTLEIHDFHLDNPETDLISITLRDAEKRKMHNIIPDQEFVFSYMGQHYGLTANVVEPSIRAVRITIVNKGPVPASDLAPIS